MKIKKLITLAAMAVMTGNVWGETDVTSMYITNADFSADDALTVHLCGYGDGISKNVLNGNNAVYGAQDVKGWKNNGIKNSGKDGAGGAGGIFAYGTAPMLVGNSKVAPAANPAGESTGKALGIFAVWEGTIQYTQEVTLPAGSYTLTFTYYNQSGTTNVNTNLFGFTTTEKNYYGSTKSFATGTWKTETVSFELEAETTGKISLGYKSPNYGSKNCPMLFVDNVKLVDITVDKAKADLKSLIDKFTVPETNVGDDAFQYPTLGIQGIKDALETAQGVYDDNDATLDNVNEQIAIVSQLTLPALNSPAANTRYSITNVSISFKHANNAMTLTNDRTGAGDYNVRYYAKPNSNFAQAFEFTFVPDKKDTYYLSQTDKDGVTRYLCLGIKYGGDKFQIRTTTTKNDAAEFCVIPMAEENNWRIRNVEANKDLGSSGENSVYTTDGNYRMVIAPAEQAQATLKVVTGVKYGTFIAPFKAEKPENVTLYSVEEVDGTTLTLVEAAEIAANTPYIVYADAEETISKTLTAYGTATKDGYQAGLLVGTLAGGEMTLDADCYLLQKQKNKDNNDVVGFYKCKDATSYKLGANRAYLKYEASAGVKAFFFGDENNETAITALSDLMSGKAEIYDLNGRKLRKLEKGINIVNGKKVIIK